MHFGEAKGEFGVAFAREIADVAPPVATTRMVIACNLEINFADSETRGARDERQEGEEQAIGLH